MNDAVRPDSSDENLLCRIRGEYLEMPGLRLTRQQAQRLWGLDDEVSTRTLQALVDLKFLVCRSDGTYARLTEGTLPDVAIRMTKAGLDVLSSQPATQKAARRS